MRLTTVRLTPMLAGVMLTGAVLAAFPTSAFTQSLVESFTTEQSVGSGVLQSNGASAVFDDGAVVYPGDSRGYLRTAQDYKDITFMAEVTLTVTSAWAGDGRSIAFFGLGEGVPNGGFYDEPYSSSSIYVRVMPSDFFPGTQVTNGGVELNDASRTTFGGDGTYRVRITFNHSTQAFTYAFQKDYTGGTFTPTFVSDPITLNGGAYFDGQNARIFFGGAGNATFDDLVILGVDCTTNTAPGLSGQFRSLASAARALRFTSEKSLLASFATVCQP